MNAKTFAVGIILVFLAFTLSCIVIPLPAITYWEPLPGIRLPTITVALINPVEWLVYPLALIGGILLVFGATSDTGLRIVLTLLLVVGIFLIQTPFWRF